MVHPQTIATGTNDALQEVREVLRIQQCVLEVLTSQIPKVNDLMVNSFEQISGEFMGIASQAGQIKSFGEQLEDASSEETRSMVKEITMRSESISQSVMQLIVAMQFQDRVSQNLVIVENVLSSVMGKMDRETKHCEHEHVTHESATRHAKEILSMLNLGEVRQPFVDKLMSDNIIADGAEIGYIPANPEQDYEEDEDDIELF